MEWDTQVGCPSYQAGGSGMVTTVLLAVGAAGILYIGGGALYQRQQNIKSPNADEESGDGAGSTDWHPHLQLWKDTVSKITGGGGSGGGGYTPVDEGVGEADGADDDADEPPPPPATSRASSGGSKTLKGRKLDRKPRNDDKKQQPRSSVSSSQSPRSTTREKRASGGGEKREKKPRKPKPKPRLRPSVEAKE